jgi:hypothetical protein
MPGLREKARVCQAGSGQEECRQRAFHEQLMPPEDHDDKPDAIPGCADQRIVFRGRLRHSLF